MRLSREQRKALFAGDAPAIYGPRKLVRELEGGGRRVTLLYEKCPVEPGDEIRLSPKLTVRVLQVIPRRGGGWQLRYEVHNKRDPVRMLRRTPPVVVPEGPENAPTEDAIKKAAQESSYTGSPVGAISDAGDAVDEVTQKRFTREATEGFKAHLERERRERQSRALDERLRAVQRAAAEKGVDLTRKLTSIERRIESAERDVGL